MSLLRSARQLLPGTADYAPLKRSWKNDLIAGITVGIVALPLALAFGVSSGAGAAAGLITAIVAGVVAAVFGGSNVQVSGPTGAMVVVLAPVIALHGMQSLALVTIMAGVIVLAAGALKLGRAVGYIPWPVIEGFTLGIAIIIFLQQVPAAFGVPAGDSTNAAVAAFQSLRNTDFSTLFWPLVLVLIVAAIMLAAPKIHPQLPGSIIGIIVATLVAGLAGLPVTRIGDLPSSLPAPSVPYFDPGLVTALLGPALTIAALAAIESLLSARVAASISDTGPYDPDRELVGQGLASVASGFFGGMPATGAIARTAVNIRAGAKTRASTIVHALVLLGVVYLATGPVGQIPLAALSGVLMVTAFRMISPATLRSVIGSTRADTVTFFVTAVITVSFDLIQAVEIGIVVAAFFALRSLVKASGVHREELPGPAQDGDEQIALFRLDGALFFGASERVLERVSAIRSVHVVIIRMSQLQILDATGARVIAELVTALERRGITVLIKGIQERHLKLATHVGVLESLRHHKHLFAELEPAVEHARSHVSRARQQTTTARTRGMS
ncbi:SulP family inorganic anion transporter [Arthrobacter crystallopoietes]|uniref:Sulfate permease, SulP family n=1 Tax=Crystallibacter crystallopoietes TaxID=37928 RepID=A0A1H1CSS9_9MICC|nr:SulP family inorganic anion transporter [Arthrobacter crystallopoietes]AUI50627.1 sodium-independent anion transporter [Arthrobacter crystallopoietes]QTG81784.1 SulP family inorganic anion transporter [Arthrobacter crystallopoietes]SDQ66938.1 sulfate permease, SulP family [Arthrobacter crystallopoietes]